MAFQMGNAVCVLGTVSDRDAFENFTTYSVFIFSKPLYLCSFEKFYRSTGIVAGMSSLLVCTFDTDLLG